MKRFISEYRKWLGYILYALILTVVLLYYCFPSDAVRDYVQAKGDRANPPLTFSAGRIGPSIPIGLKFMKTEVSLQDAPNSLILKADRLWLKRPLWSLFLGKPQYSFHCIAYKGDVSGTVRFEKDQPQQGFIDMEMALKNIHVGNYPYLSHLIGRPIEGILGGTVSYRGKYSPMLDGSGEANLKLSDGRVELLQPFLTLESIDFDEMEIDMVFEKQGIRVTRLALKGQQLRGTLSGTVALKEEIAKSTLDLSGTIEPFAALFKNTTDAQNTVAFLKERLNKGTLSFSIQGTLGKPKVQFT